MLGKFIAIEGIDGTGKSTLARRLVTTLELASAGEMKSICVHEPGSLPLEGTIRELFKREEGPLCPEAMSVLFTADRLLCMEQNKERMSSGITVITDRHKLSTRVYQEVNGCDRRVLKTLCDVPSPNPDLTIILDIDPEVARQRMVARNPELDSYESDLSKQRKMRQLYLAYSAEYGNSMIINVTRKDEDEVCEIATRVIWEAFKNVDA